MTDTLDHLEAQSDSVSFAVNEEQGLFGGAE